MFLVAAALIVSQIRAQAIDTDIYFSGAKAGTNHYVVGKDKSIESLTKANLQGFDIDSHLSISYTAGKPTGLSFLDTMKQKSKTLRYGKLEIRNGKAALLTTEGGKPTEFSMVISEPYFSTFHPQIFGTMYGKVKWDNRTKQDIQTFLVEGASPIPIGVKPTDRKSVLDATTGQLVATRSADLTLGSLTFKGVFTDDGTVAGIDIPSQKFRMVRRGFESIFEDPLAKYPELSQPTFEVETVHVDVPMRDGVVTKATLVRPTKKGKYPVVLERTPYGRLLSAGEGDMYAKRGYVFVVQDARGTGDSKGKFDPMVTERKDGYDTIDWISKQDWCDGNVGMIGASYGGFVQWAAAVEHHPALKCLVPQVSPPSSAMWNLPYENGVLTLLSDLWWLRIVDNPKGQNMLTALNAITNMKGLLTLPLDKADDKLLGFNSKIFTEWLKRDTSTKWSGWDFDAEMKTVKIPALHISGWFDGDEIGTQRNWQFVRSGGNDQQWLIYGPWTHFFNTTTKVGNLDFGKDAVLELDSQYLRWFDTWLKGKSVGFEKVPKVRYFAMGENKWHESQDWPPVESKPETLYFEFGKGNYGPKSGAKLVKVLTKNSSVKSDYNPRKEKIGADSMGVGDQGQDMYMKDDKVSGDNIILRSEPFEQDTLITGPVVVEFDFKSSARDTDFFALGMDQDPIKGHVAVFRPGKLKASYLQGLDKQRFLTPGKTYRARLQLWDGANLFKKGHRLSILILQSIFPGSARNLGTTQPILTGTKMVTQHNVIFSTKKSPAKITFQVVQNP
jgi:putative CocE/NonD family hydrolase